MTHLCQTVWKELRGTLGKPNAGIRGDQPDTLQSAFLEMLEERAPARLILLRPLANAKNLPITALVHADRNQQRDVAHLARPAALEHDAVEINIRVVALDRTIAPRLDRPVDLLVQVRHGRGRHPRAPQCLRDVLDPAHRYPCQIHLDQRLFDRALATPVALDNRRLEGLRPKLGDLQPYLAGLGPQLALIVARARVPTRLAALVALRIAQSVRFGFKQRVQRLLHALSHDPVKVALDPLVVNRDDIVQRTRCSLGHEGSFSPTWLRLATSSSARFGPASPT